MTKRILSWLLVLVMVLGMFPIPTYAAEIPNEPDAGSASVGETLPADTDPAEEPTQPAEEATEPDEEEFITTYADAGTVIFTSGTDGTWAAANVEISTFCLSGATVASYTWDGDTCQVVLAADTAKDATITLATGTMNGNAQFLAQHTYSLTIDGTTTDRDNTGTVNLVDGQKTLDVSLSRGYTVTKTFILTVEDGNSAPALVEGVSAEVDSYIGVGRTYRMLLSDIFTDADGDELTYTVKVGDADPVSAANDYAYTPAAQGTYTLIFTASDGKATATYTVNLHANPETNIFTAGTDGSWASGVISVQNLYLSGADVESYTWDGDTCNVVLAAGTPANAPITFFPWLTGNGMYLAQHLYTILIDGVATDCYDIGTVFLSEGQKTVQVSLARGTTVTKTFVLTVASGNHAPTLVEGVSPEEDVYVGVGRTYYVYPSDIFTDADGDELTYTVKVGDADPVSTGTSYAYTPDAQGVYTLVFTASDGEATATYTVRVHANPDTSIFTAETDGTWDPGAVYVKNLYLSGANVESYTWDGDTCNVVLAEDTALNAPIAFWAFMGGRSSNHLIQHLYTITIDGVDTDIRNTGTVYLANGQKTVDITLSCTKVLTKTIVLTVASNNQAPALADGVSAEVDAYVGVGRSYKVDLSKIFTDADGDELTYTVKVGDAEAVSTAASYTYIPGEQGIRKLIFTASDGKATATYTVTLHANPETKVFTAGTNGTWTAGVVYVENLYLSGADVESYTWDGDTCNIVLAEGTAQNAPITFRVWMGGNQFQLAQHMYSIVIDGVTTDLYDTETVCLADGQKTLEISLVRGGSVTKTIVLSVSSGNQAPTLAEGVDATAEASVSVGTAYTLDLGKVFTDADGDELSYTVSVDGAEAVEAATSYSYTPTAAGSYTLVFTASDGKATATYTVTLTAELSVHVTLTINDAGNLVLTDEPVTVTDTDGDGILTYHDALAIVHEKYDKDYVAEKQSMGRFVTVLWGKNTGGNNLFFINHAPIKLSVGTDTVSEGDYLYASTLQDASGYSDYYTFFTDRRLTVNTGTDFTLTLKGFAGMTFGTPTPTALSGISVGLWKDGKFSAIDGKTTGEDGTVTLRFDEPGTYVVTASGSIASTDWLGNSVTAPMMPPVCIVTVDGTPVTEYLSELKFTASSKNEYELTMSPVFDPATGEYTLYVPEALSYIYAWATLADDQTGDITMCYTATTGAEKAISVTSGKTSGTALTQCFPYNSLTGNTVTVQVGGEDAYIIHIVRIPSLKTLKLTLADGTAVSLDPKYYCCTGEYSAFIPADAVVTVAATTYLSDATVTVCGGTETTVTPVWEGQKFDLTLKVSVDGVPDTVYTVHLYENTQSISINTPPTKTEYAMGDTFDPTGMTLLGTYTDGSTKVLTPDDFTWEPTGALTASVQSVTVSYNGLTAEQPITVTSPFTGNGTVETPYQLKTTEDLALLSELVQSGLSFSGEQFKVMNNITLPTTDGENPWVPLGVDKNTPFSGNIDGGGFTITVPKGGLPLIGCPVGAKVSNMSIYGEQIESCGLVHSYVIGATIDIDHVTLKSGSKTLKSGFIGGYASGSNAIHISDCTVEAGVIIGYDKSQSNIGSFGGDYNGTITNCVSHATVYGVNFVGGICGSKGQTMGTFAITGCTFDGTVVATGNYVGGICGHGYGGTSWGIASAPNTPMVTIQDCVCSGSVTGGDYVGGILGAESGLVQCWNNGIGYVTGNRFTGTITSSGSYVGGVIGYMRSLNRYTNISNNFYTGAAKGIGGVMYVDTNCETHETESGAIYFNTEESTAGCPSVQFCSWKKQHNRTDDPLGADADKLCYTTTHTDPVATKLTVSGTFKTEYVLGEELDLSGIVLTVSFNEGEDTVVTLDDVTVTGYDKNTLGEQTITITYSGVPANITVNVRNATKEITVKLTILGDSKHGDNGSIHTLIDGNLTTWVSTTAYTVDANSTVWDVVKTCLDEKGYTYSNPSGNYIVSVNGLGEIDNGGNSGWMYTLNGTHPLLGVSEQKLKEGDVIILHYTDDYTKEEGSWTDDDDDAARKVDDLIDKIGTVTLTDACKQKIDAARKAYKSLSAADKAKVTKLPTLEAAEKKYQELKTADDRAKANAVVSLIDKIGNPVTLDDEKAIQAARSAYDALTTDQKALVSNYAKLTAAETALAKLKATKADEDAAKKVSDAIDALGDITLDSEQAITDARKAYDSLTDLQKNLVENLSKLENAEKKLAELKAAQKIRDAYKATGDYLEALGTPGVGSVGGEWMALGLLRSGRKVDEAYYQAVLQYVQENIDENERLHHAKSTENSRIILALTAMGKDVTDVDGHNLLMALNDLDFVRKQGINGPIWALIALDSGNYPVPEGTVTRQALIDLILEAQTSDGGWAISGDEADSDMTGMALQALAPYYASNDDVKKAVDAALTTLSELQNEDGGFGTFAGTEKVATSESVSQVLVALTALGIDPLTDARFVKNGRSTLDALLDYFVDGGGFRHMLDGSLDGMATEQGYYALTAYFRMLDGKTALYDMTDVIDRGGDPVSEAETIPEDSTTEPADAPEASADESEEHGISGWIIATPVSIAAIAAVVLVLKKKLH